MISTSPSLMVACLHVLGQEDDDISVIHSIATLHQWRGRVSQGVKVYAKHEEKIYITYMKCFFVFF